MALTVNELADHLGVACDDIRVLIAQFPGDVPLWGDAEVLTPDVCEDLARVLSPHGERDIPQR